MVCLRSWASSFSLHSFLISLIQVFQRILSVKSNLSLLVFSVASGLHLVVNALHLDLWRCQLIVDFDNYCTCLNLHFEDSELGTCYDEKRKNNEIFHFRCLCGHPAFLVLLTSAFHLLQTKMLIFHFLHSFIPHKEAFRTRTFYLLLCSVFQFCFVHYYVFVLWKSNRQYS